MTLATIDRGTGAPVVLLHGQPGSGSSWCSLVPLLEQEFRVLAPDRMGYGDTPGEARGLADNAESVAELLQGLDTGPATVVAHSWSGGAAVLLAVRYPSLVRSLVLVGAACTPDSLNALDRWLTVPVVGNALTVVGLFGIGAVLPQIRRLTPYAPAAVRTWMEASLPDHGVMGEARGSLGRARRSFMIEQRALTDEMPMVVEALGALDLTVEVVAGDWDLVVPPSAAVSLTRSIAGAELTLVPRSGHFVARDAPERLVEVIRRATRASPRYPGSEG